MIRVPIHDHQFPIGSEYNLGKLGVVRARRDKQTRVPYIDCKNEEQVKVLQAVLNRRDKLAAPAPIVTPEVQTPQLTADVVTTHDKTVTQIAAMIEKVTRPVDIESLLESEQAHHKGARRGV